MDLEKYGITGWVDDSSLTDEDLRLKCLKMALDYYQADQWGNNTKMSHILLHAERFYKFAKKEEYNPNIPSEE